MRIWLVGWWVALTMPVWAAQGLGMGYEPKYPDSFKHFDYVNPDAPKGGHLTLSASGSFDKLNPFTLKGTPPAGMGYSSNGFVFAEYGLVFDSLMTPSEDEPFSNYGLLAEDVLVAPDQMSVTFRLNPKARFSDNTPVLAQDVKHSFDTLMSQQAGPTFRSYWSDIKAAVVIDDRRIRFEFKRRNSELHMIIGQMPVFSRAWGRGKPFDQVVDEPPVASGPYVVDKVDPGKSISYRRRPDYWAADLPVRKGMFNFDKVSYQYFRDRLGEEESIKVGALDALEETSITAWVRRYKGRRFDSGEIVKTEISHRRFTGMRGLAVNLRQPRFADIRVRQALALAFDFDWLNQRLFYGRRARTMSYFQNSDDLMARPELGPDERALIARLVHRQDYLRIVQGPLPRPAATGDTPEGLRRNLVEAQALLKAAGWSYRDGALRDGDGKPFVIEIDIADRSSEPVLAPYARNLGKLGISLQYRLRDAALIKKRLDDFDFDMALQILGGSSSPGNELYDDLGSKSAAERGSQNFSGISDPVIDELIDIIVKSPDRASLATAVRLLDRFLLHQHYVVPLYYGKQYYMVHKRNLRRPDAELPQRLLAGSALLTTWWMDPPKIGERD
ncbi:extracellular solute-binding protein [Variovorax ginsengisoli]|uniref:Extracellular solute-binding protein n=1 Tax=Variovorax ginsengisoli TaxID=363844 RepID=A0ABT8S8H5_9BURK|nr:extracellular solute-binding protein [Variovorax ginsengisoli]MDN8616024.1 extracellular solute-binding protein [Variovorax ginsengisoli]MDO1535194.1 extracellular solute-binding protein [Variovorax ginsengisoli]